MSSVRCLAAAVVLAGSAWMGGHGAAGTTVAAAQGCSPASTTSSGSSAALSNATNSFGFRLLDRLGTSKNVVISPVSLELALAMAYDGARGSTRQSMARALSLGGLTPGAVRGEAAALLSALHTTAQQGRLDIANALWARNGIPFRPRFLADARHDFAAHVASLSFGSPSAPGTINAWVSCATHGTIPSIIKNIPPNIILYLMNAVYFQGQWTQPFNPSGTHLRAFTTGATVEQVPSMDETGTFPYTETPTFRAVTLPYGTGRFGMTLVLPRAGASLATLTQRLTSGMWQSWLAQLRPRHGEVALPRLTLSETYRLNGPLSALGMSNALSNNADFHGMCLQPCRLNEVRHKTYLKVDEKGTVASGATSVSVSPTAIQVDQFHLIIDHPFLLAIRDSVTGAILFLGAVTNPLG